MPTRDEVIAGIRQHLEALKAARLAELEATAPRFTTSYEPGDYARLAGLIEEALTRLSPGLMQQVRDELCQRYAQGYPPAAHAHSWATITGKPATYPPERHQLSALATGLDEVRARPVRWRNIEGKPAAYPPGPHTHEELVALYDLFSHQGKPGQVLMRTSTGVEWRDPPVNIVYQMIGGGGGGSVPPEPPATIAGIVDSTGTYLVDSSGTYVEAV